MHARVGQQWTLDSTVDTHIVISLCTKEYDIYYHVGVTWSSSRVSRWHAGMLDPCALSMSRIKCVRRDDKDSE